MCISNTVYDVTVCNINQSNNVQNLFELTILILKLLKISLRSDWGSSVKVCNSCNKELCI